MISRRLWLAVWLLASACVGVLGADGVDGLVHAPDSLPEVDVPPAAAPPTHPPCSVTTQDKLTKFSLVNMALQRQCYEQSGGVNAFPFDVAPSREQLVRLSASPVCLLLCKGILRLVEQECALGDFQMPLRATAETVLKLNQDRKDLTRYPIPSEEVVQQLILQRASMNAARDVDPIGFSVAMYPDEMHQYEAQLTKAYATGGIVLLSSEFKILNDLTTTEQQVGSAAASAAVAELISPTESAPSSGSGAGSEPYVDSSTDNEHDTIIGSSSSASETHGSFREEPTSTPTYPGSASGSLTDAAVVTPQATSVACPSALAPSVAIAALGVLLVIT